MLFVRKGIILILCFCIIYFYSLYKEDVLYQGDTKDLPKYQSKSDIPSYIQETTKIPEVVEKSKMKAFWDIFLSMTNIDILKEKKMIIICLVNHIKIKYSFNFVFF